MVMSRRHPLRLLAPGPMPQPLNPHTRTYAEAVCVPTLSTCNTQHPRLRTQQHHATRHVTAFFAFCCNTAVLCYTHLFRNAHAHLLARNTRYGRHIDFCHAIHDPTTVHPTQTAGFLLQLLHALLLMLWLHLPMLLVVPPALRRTRAAC